MTLYKQDVLDLAGLENSIAASLLAQNTSSTFEQDSALYLAYRGALERAAAMTAIAATLAGSADPTLMPAAQPNGSWTATGRVCKIDFDQNSPGQPSATWNSRFHDQQTSNSGTFVDGDHGNAALPWYMLGRTGNTSDANQFGSAASPAGSGIYPDLVMETNHTNVAGYPINDVLAGLTAGYAYDVTFFGSRQQTPRYTQFTVGNDPTVKTSQILDCSYNTSRTVSFPKTLPSPNGNLYFAWDAATVNGTQSPNMDLAAMVVTEYRPA